MFVRAAGTAILSIPSHMIKTQTISSKNCKNWYLVAYIEWLHKPVYKKQKHTEKFNNNVVGSPLWRI